MKPDNSVGIDPLKYEYLIARKQLTTEEDALKNDLTQKLYETLKLKIKHKELIVFAIIGEVRTAKSTVLYTLVKEINEYLNNMGINKGAHKRITKYIFSDQTEFMRFINTDERNVCTMIDENNLLSKTGLNATTESAFYEQYSDHFAGQYIHRGTASPDIITDKNATIILETIGKDEQKGIVRCKLIYRDIVTKTQITLGRVDINVKQTIKNWQEHVRPIIETKKAVTQQEKDKIQHWAKKDPYIQYQIKKYKRLSLTKDEGIRDIRELEYADIILDIIIELEEYSKIEKIDTEIILSVTDEIIRRHKKIYSIPTKQDIATKARGILTLHNKITKMYKKLNTKNMNATERHIYTKTINQVKTILEARIQEQKKLSRIYEKYKDTNGTEI